MLTFELLDRVDAWLAHRRDDPAWGRQGSMTRSRRWQLILAWDEVAAGLRRWPTDRGAQASATGILLALVREAWGASLVESQHDYTRRLHRVAVGSEVGEGDFPGMRVVHEFTGATEADALVAALEAAP